MALSALVFPPIVNTVAVATVAPAADSTQPREMKSLMWGNRRPLPRACSGGGGIIVTTLECLEEG